jgi:flagellar basal-body rod protein FlgG
MAITALHSAATGLRALSTRIDVVANNLANAETNTFKRSRVNFEDLMYSMLKQPGATNAAGEVSPAGIYVGLGTKISNTQLDLEQGPMENTGRNLDVGIEGQGFFKVKLMDSIGGGIGYTRNGNFFVNKDGDLVIGSGDGYKVIPPIKIPQGTTDISISKDGTISTIAGVTNQKKQAGQLTPTDTKPGVGGTGTILQSFLEGSNVDPVKELVTLIKTQRAFELNSQSIQTADQALQTIGNLRRG